MCKSESERLWELVFENYYNTFYQEILALRISRTWYIMDSITKPLILLTTGGLAVSGWALWSDPTLNVFWNIIAGIGAVAAILRTIFNPVKKNAVWEQHMRVFRSTRLLFEKLQQNIMLDDEPIDDYKAEFDLLSAEYRSEMLRTPNDILISDKFEEIIQQNLNKRLAGRIDNGNEKASEDG